MTQPLCLNYQSYSTQLAVAIRLTPSTTTNYCFFHTENMKPTHLGQTRQLVLIDYGYELKLHAHYKRNRVGHLHVILQ